MADNNRWPSVGIVVSVAFGLTVALLAVLDVGSLGVIAAVGGILVGAMWLLIVMLGSRTRGPDRS